MDHALTASRARELLELHRAPELLSLVNVWDVASARVVAATPGTRALATASYAIAATYGFEDGERIPRDLMLDMVGRIVAATDLPVTADLEAGYGDPAETIRRAVEVGVVGANLEDELRPVAEAADRVAAALAAARDAGVPDFVLNARTDAFLRPGGREPAAVLDDAIERGLAYLAAGAPVVFVPGLLDLGQVEALVAAFGPRRLTLLGVPGTPPLADLARCGVARVSFGPYPQRVALTALQELVEGVQEGRGVPDSMRPLT